MLILLIVLLLLFGAGGGYYGYSRWGYGGGAGVSLGTIVFNPSRSVSSWVLPLATKIRESSGVR